MNGTAHKPTACHVCGGVYSAHSFDCYTLRRFDFMVWLNWRPSSVAIEEKAA